MHTPVLLKEVVAYLQPAAGKKIIDATFGGGGHAKALAENGAEILGIDRDPEVVERIENFESRINAVQGDFRNLKEIAKKNDFLQVDGILFDLGMGSHQLDDAKRGFAFQKEGPLDMRFDQTKGKTAGELINFYPEKDIVEIFQKYGEERRFAKKIARAILEKRKIGEIKTTTELFEIIKAALPGNIRFRAGDAARKIFQALRISVNKELSGIEDALPQALEILKQNGRIAVISFHSLEDRIVKRFFVEQAKNCICPLEFPVCRCMAKALLRILTKKPIIADDLEIKENPRAKSAKMRVAEKIWEDSSR
ncbi:MAG: 16S rRNA (cytosine(1402)-N(4))-methyltransferase RsmH [bacterium]|nr:16S rRNA (cytosine(1402)-N(4))-methyltransferase RsmH [bacterium]